MCCKKFSLLLQLNHCVNLISACLPIHMTESEQQAQISLLITDINLNVQKSLV